MPQLHHRKMADERHGVVGDLSSFSLGQLDQARSQAPSAPADYAQEVGILASVVFMKKLGGTVDAIPHATDAFDHICRYYLGLAAREFIDRWKAGKI